MASAAPRSLPSEPSPHVTEREGAARRGAGPGLVRGPQAGRRLWDPGAGPGRRGAELPGGGAAGGAEGEGGCAAAGHLKWPRRGEGRFPREGRLAAAREVGVCARRPRRWGEVGGARTCRNFLLDGQRAAWARTAEPLEAGACGDGGWCQGTWPRGGKGSARAQRGCQGPCVVFRGHCTSSGGL